MDMNQVLAAELNVKPWQVEAAVKLTRETRSLLFHDIEKKQQVP